uniref:Uncharacterized protein n=1 Tax=Meloidogyne incognita TaxID=6306 RepID=A0A914M2P5_MELIC
MEEENEQLDYDELDDLEIARKKCKELQKAIVIDALHAEETSSTSKNDDNQEVLGPATKAIQQQKESLAMTSQNHQSSSTFPPGTEPFSISTAAFPYSPDNPPPPGVSSVPIILSSIPPPITSNIPRPSLQQQQNFGSKYYVNPKFNNNKNFYKRSKTFYKKFAPPTIVNSNVFPQLAWHKVNNLTSRIGASTVQLGGGTLPINNQNLHVPHVQDPQTVGLPPFLPTNPHLTAVSTPSTTSFLPPTTGNNIYINRSVLQTTNSWNAMVDEFVRKNVTSEIRPRHYIPYLKQSRSRSSSSGTSRRSNSCSSASSVILRNRSCSVTDDSANNDYSKRRRIEPTEGEVYHSSRRRKSYDNGQRRSRRYYKEVREDDEEIAHNQAIECARAIGLDEDYLKKIEEQQRLRDEILRKKTQKRKEKEAAIKGMEILNRKNSKMDGVSKGGNESDLKQQEESRQQQQKRHSSSNSTRKSTTNKTSKTSEQTKEKEEINKLRPYLAVVCTNLRGITSVEKKIGALAATIGKTKKIWRVGGDDCHIIFEKHEHAKQFMLQYYGKRLGNAPSTRIDVVLKKVFLNISSQPTD